MVHGSRLKILHRMQSNTRICPECGKEIIHKGLSARKNCKRLKKSGALCMSCSKMGERNPVKNPQVQQKIKQTILNKYNGYIGSNNPMYGKHHTEESKKKIKEKLLGKKNIVHSRWMRKNCPTKRPDVRQKLRESRAKQILRDGWGISKGTNETKILDNIEKQENSKIDRQFSVIGFFPDGYCHETNTIYEVYEKFHDNQVGKDFERETAICNYLSCNFIIIWEK